jgi:hypothetical protein
LAEAAATIRRTEAEEGAVTWTVSKREIRGPGGALPVRDGDEVAQDLLLLIEGETSGRPLPDVLAEFHCARSVYYEKLRRFREVGIEGLLRKSPGPKRPWRRTHDVVRRVVQLRLENPMRAADSLAEQLNREGLRVSVRSVQRILADFGLTHGPEGAR